jgi:hypothetical protein
MMATSRGAFVPIEKVWWLPEVSTQETPETALMAREEEQESDEDAEVTDARNAAIRALEVGKLRGLFEQIPATEALALAMHLGLLGYQPTYQVEIAETLGVASQQIVAYMVRRARERILYLATRPAIDVAVLARALPPAKLEIVRRVYETTSFAEVGRERWPCPDDRTGPKRRAWVRVHATKVKREFFRALAKLEKRPDLASQVGALRHLVEHLGAISRHAGKGTWSRRHCSNPPSASGPTVPSAT